MNDIEHIQNIPKATSRKKKTTLSSVSIYEIKWNKVMNTMAFVVRESGQREIFVLNKAWRLNKAFGLCS